MKFDSGEWLQGNCLELMKQLPNQSVDMILCDLPYGITACSWDSVIPFEPLWEQYNRLIKGFGAIVLFGAEPFSTTLRASNLSMFKYDWIWCKSRILGFLNAKNKPMNQHEIVSVFSKGSYANRSERLMPYYPQGLKSYGKMQPGRKKSEADLKGHRFGSDSQKEEYIQENTNYPTSLLKFSNEGKVWHPTQKPVALFEYLIKTYTLENQIVLDNTAGSGTTAIAAINTNRKWICMEQDQDYSDKAIERIRKHVKQKSISLENYFE